MVVEEASAATAPNAGAALAQRHWRSITLDELSGDEVQRNCAVQRRDAALMLIETLFRQPVPAGEEAPPPGSTQPPIKRDKGWLVVHLMHSKEHYALLVPGLLGALTTYVGHVHVPLLAKHSLNTLIRCHTTYLETHRVLYPQLADLTQKVKVLEKINPSVSAHLLELLRSHQEMFRFFQAQYQLALQRQEALKQAAAKQAEQKALAEQKAQSEAASSAAASAAIAAITGAEMSATPALAGAGASAPAATASAGGKAPAVSGPK
jgi:hypothetical protein